MSKYVIVVLCVLAITFVALADTLVLKDGKRIEGTIIGKIGTEYRIKGTDGTVHKVSESQIQQIIKGSSPSAGATAGAGTAPKATPAPKGKIDRELAPPSTSLPPGVSSAFADLKRRADAVDAPIIAVTLWERFIDSNPAEADRAAAKMEMERWQSLQNDGAEKIGGKWVGGKDRKELMKKVNELIAEGYKALSGSQTVQGIAKLEEALKLYPHSFEANFELGYFYLTKGVIGSTGRGNVQYLQKAITALERARDITPNSAATWSNLAIAYNFRSKYAESVQAAYKAAKIQDDKEVVQNLVNSIAHAPRGMQTNNDKIKPIMEDTIILAGKHGISLKGGNWVYIRPRAAAEEGEEPGAPDVSSGKPGVAWSGSGFFVTPDGYLLTNHHVATGDAKGPILRNISFRVRMADGTERNADLIAVDDKADIALMKIKTESPVPYLKLADDNPKQASKALVLGYPATSLFGSDMSLQISEGQVKSVNPGDEHEVWFDLNTTHGNSGGPIVDKNCRVVAILTAGRQVYNVWYVLGVGPKQMRTFLDSIGDKCPSNLEWTPVGSGDFDGEALTDEARKSTLLILAVRGAGRAESIVGDSQPAESTEGTGAPGVEAGVGVAK